jgi:hypothetical protein
MGMTIRKKTAKVMVGKSTPDLLHLPPNGLDDDEAQL